MMSESKIVEFLDDHLSIDEIQDESQNGMQVDAAGEINKIVFAVDVRKDIVERATEAGADMLFVHHGFIWGEGFGTLTGKYYQIVKMLFENDTSLYAAHLPLDIHPKVGNNVELANLLGAEIGEPFMEYKGTNIARMANFKEEKVVVEIAEELERKLDTETYTVGEKKTAKKIGILTGKGGQALEDAKNNGAELFITGERTYTTYNEAIDMEIPIIFAGHYATETLGLKKVKDLLEEKFDVETGFLDAKTTI